MGHNIEWEIKPKGHKVQSNKRRTGQNIEQEIKKDERTYGQK
jgi:hypothetical protein